LGSNRGGIFLKNFKPLGLAFWANWEKITAGIVFWRDLLGGPNFYIFLNLGVEKEPQFKEFPSFGSSPKGGIFPSPQFLRSSRKKGAKGVKRV